MSDKITVLKEVTYPVQGTTKLRLYDEDFDQSGTDLEFFGNISAAPLGLLRIRKVHVVCEPDEYFKNGFEYDEYKVDVFQAKNEAILEAYEHGQYYPKAVKKRYGLNCETASFVCETKFGSDKFSTGADGYYANLTQMKQYYGMILHFSFADDMFTFEELEGRFLCLWAKRKAVVA
ncbi:MAG: hypothetical protein J6I68_11370 [Butyrivibrio sp.]|uniref:hypothetical protein n=1 Tax=Butyrivibrio sp. TaxID=28121 RepID=UPI001B434EAB|nr:hypothetical protein [Butyrivibrio sp.]MBP3783835.1 hypothetical protein [Butyrivibrio sp.]